MKVAKGDSADVDAAVAAAKGVFDDGAWSRAKPSFRRQVLTKVADLIEARSDDIIALQALEMGGPVGRKHRGPHPVAGRSAYELPVLRPGAGDGRPASRSAGTTTC